jgi:ribosomal protein S18 acetylase RimI-like enzyme
MTGTKGRTGARAPKKRTESASPGAVGTHSHASARQTTKAQPNRFVLQPIRSKHRPAIRRLLRETGFFKPAEVVIAIEVIDAYLAAPDLDYTALGAFTPGGELVGYVCYGPTPLTEGTYDLYWIAVAPAYQNEGVGTELVQEVERRLARADARLVIIETSSQPLYEPTRAFYLRRGYAEVARVRDFFAEGDDRVIYAKRIQLESKGKPNGQVAGHSEGQPDHGR